MSYPTLSDVQTYLGVTVATDDVVLSTILTGARGFIEGPGGAGRLFAVDADTTRRYDGESDVSRDRRTLYTFDDLCAITSITNGDSVAVPLNEIVTEPRNETPYFALTIKRSSSQVWTWNDTPESAISITGRWGYSTTPPADIVQAFYLLCAYLYRRRDNSGQSDRMIVADSGALLAQSSVPKEVMSILAQYRRRSPW